MAELRVTSTGTIKLFESDDTSSVTIASPASLGGDRTITLPDADVDLTEVNTMPIANLDIDGGTDIGANIADSDLFIIDDGAGGTNRKTAASRLKTYVGAGAGAFDIANLDIDGGTDIGADIADSDLFIIDDGAGGTNRKTAASRIKSYVGGGGLVPIAQSQSTSATGAVNFDGCFTTTYKNYFVLISQFVPASSGTDMIMRFRDSSPATLTGNDYAFGGETNQNNDGSETTNYGDNQARFQITHGLPTDANKLGAAFAMHIHKPYDSATYTRFNATYSYVATSGYLRAGAIGGAYQQNSSVRGVRFEMSSGNTDAHDVRIYGIVDS